MTPRRARPAPTSSRYRSLPRPGDAPCRASTAGEPLARACPLTGSDGRLRPHLIGWTRRALPSSSGNRRTRRRYVRSLRFLREPCPIASRDPLLRPPRHLRRSVGLLSDFRYEQTDPDLFYGALARDSVELIGDLHRGLTDTDLTGAIVLDVGGGPGYFADAFSRAGARYVRSNRTRRRCTRPD